MNNMVVFKLTVDIFACNDAGCLWFLAVSNIVHALQFLVICRSRTARSSSDTVVILQTYCLYVIPSETH